jgi:LCP family protein required for cell wall assembly
VADTGRQQGIGASVILALVSGLLWGVAHLCVGRHKAGFALMGLYLFLIIAGLTLLTGFRAELLGLAVQPRWLALLAAGLVALAAGWAWVIVRSFRLVRPDGMTGITRIVAFCLVGALALTFAVPVLYSARIAWVSRDLVDTVFHDRGRTTTAAGGTAALAPRIGRITVLLIGADAAPSRPGVRTDSMTVASIDAATGRTVLFGLPRNLTRAPLPSGPARDRFPFGFTGDSADTPGLLNEVYQFAEDHPETVPNVPAGHRGPILLKQTAAEILGMPVDHYVLLDMRGFAEIIDAIGGVEVTVRQPIVYGRHDEGLIPAGTRRLSGAEALWFGRSRTGTDDYVRMGRQKCLLNAVARQAEPMAVLRHFEEIAGAAKHAVSTDIPQDLLPGLAELARTMRASEIESVDFVPPLISTAGPDYALIREKVREALDPRRPPAATRTDDTATADKDGDATRADAGRPGRTGPTAAPSPESRPGAPGTPTTPAAPGSGLVDLDTTCS